MPYEFKFKLYLWQLLNDKYLHVIDFLIITSKWCSVSLSIKDESMKMDSDNNPLVVQLLLPSMHALVR